MTIDELKEARQKAWQELLESATQYHSLEPLFRQIEDKWLKDKETYRVADYRLAEVDGRLERIQAAAANGKSKKKEKTPDLTEEQIVELAKRLGIELQEVD
jgi:chromosome segregation ATPase